MAKHVFLGVVVRALPALGLSLAVLKLMWLVMLCKWLLRLLLKSCELAVTMALAVGVFGLFTWSQRLSEADAKERIAFHRRFIQRYHPIGSTAGSSIVGCSTHRSNPHTKRSPKQLANGLQTSGFHLRIFKRMPLACHLHTCWRLPELICQEIATFVQRFVHENVTKWFQEVSDDQAFPQEIGFLLGDCAGALLSRLLNEMDLNQALQLATNCMELVRLHFAWFRELFAQLAEEFPQCFDDLEGANDDKELLLAQRQQLMALRAQKSRFLHPACILPLDESNHGNGGFPAGLGTDPSVKTLQEMKYLRHLATQCMLQISSAFRDHDTNLFTSIGLAFVREQLVAKCFCQMLAYTEPRYSNDLIIQLLQGIGDLGESLPVESPDPAAQQQPQVQLTQRPIQDAKNASESSSKQSQLDALSRRNSIVSKLHGSSFHYKATKHLGTVDVAVASLGLEGVGAVPVEGDDEYDDDKDDAANEGDNGSGTSRKCTPPTSTTDLNLDGMSPTRANGPNNSGLTVQKHLDDLRNIKANLETSLNDSLLKLRNRFKKNTVSTTLPNGEVVASSVVGSPPASPSPSLARLFSPGAKNDCDHGSLALSVAMPAPAPVHPLSPAHRLVNRFKMKKRFRVALFKSNEVAVEPITPNALPTSPTGNGPDKTFAPMPDPLVAPTERLQAKLVGLLDNAVTNYLKAYHDRLEIRHSACCRELHEFLVALEDVFVLGLRVQPLTTGGGSSSTGGGHERGGGSPSATDSKVTRHTCRGSMTGFTTDDLDDRRAEEAVVALEEDGTVGYYWRYLSHPRHEPRFLDELVAFVTNRLPLCQESDFFYCTRGIQWILVALEKGSLWENVTALHLGREVTESFYDENAVLRSDLCMQKVLKVLLRLNEIRVQLNIRPLRTDAQAEDVSCSMQMLLPLRVVESVWEMEIYVPLHGWTRTTDKRFHDLPSSEWIWESDWRLDKDPSSSDTNLVDPGAPIAGDGWEYARSAFEDRFRDKEKRFDSIRRRKWTRSRKQLTPVLVLPPSYSSSSQLMTTNEGSNEGTQAKGCSAVESSQCKDMDASRPKETRLVRTRSTDIGRIVDEAQLVATSSNIAVDDSCLQPHSDLRRSDPGITLSPSSRAEPPAPSSNRQRPELNITVNESEDGRCCFRCLKPMRKPVEALSPSFVSPKATTTRVGCHQCRHCHQLVCTPCYQFHAFLVYPPVKDKGRREQVCVSCYQRLVARYKLQLQVDVVMVMRGTSKSSPSGGREATTSGGSGGADSSGGNALSSSFSSSSWSNCYEIHLQSVATSHRWSVIKSFADVETLEKKLLDKKRKQEKKRLGHWKAVDFMELTFSLNGAHAEVDISASATSEYDRKLVLVEAFLRRLVASDSLCQSAPVQKFLLLGDKQRKSSLGAGANNKLLGGPTATTNAVAGGGGAGAPNPLESKSKWQANARKWLNLDGQKAAKMRVLQKLELCLFSFLNEIFEFDGFGLLRRNLFVLVRRCIHVALNSSHFGMLEQKYRHLTDPITVVSLLERFRAWMFPSDLDAIVPAGPSQGPDIVELRKQSLDAIAKHLPPALVSLFGETACENASLKLHEFCQHQLFLKNLLFSICDELGGQLFGEFVLYKSSNDDESDDDEGNGSNQSRTSPASDRSKGQDSQTTSNNHANRRRHSHGPTILSSSSKIN